MVDASYFANGTFVLLNLSTRSIFKLYLIFFIFFSRAGCLTKAKEPILLYQLHVAVEK